MLGGHWDMLARMLDEAYGSSEYDSSTIILGCYVHQSVTELKDILISTNQYHGGKIVIYQTEPLVDGHWWSTERIVQNIKDADEIWDYDLQNIQILRSYGLNAKFRPPTYASCLLRVDNSKEKDIDVLFYGSLTPYRYDVINNVITGAEVPDEYLAKIFSAKFAFLYNVVDNTLDEMIGRSKIILNINPYAGECRQQQTRIFYALANNKCVLSQKSSINYYDDLIVEYDDWVDLFHKIVYLLDGDRWKQYTNLDYYNQSLKMRRKIEEILSYE